MYQRKAALFARIAALLASGAVALLCVDYGPLEGGQPEAGAPVALDLSNRRQLTIGELLALQKLSSLRSLNLSSAGVTDAHLQVVCKLATLEELNLGYTMVTDGGVSELKRLKKLRALWAHGTRITDEGMPTLAALSTLRILWLSTVTDSGLKERVTVPNLEDWCLGGNCISNNRISNNGMEHVSKCANLQRLALYGGVRVEKDGLLMLSNIKTLRSLSLEDMPIGKTELNVLVSMRRLEHLHLSNVGTLDDGLDGVAKLEGLKVLRLPRAVLCERNARAIAALADLGTLTKPSFSRSPFVIRSAPQLLSRLLCGQGGPYGQATVARCALGKNRRAPSTARSQAQG